MKAMGADTNTVEEFIKTDREAFRAEATDALKQFTPEDREFAASLETDTITAATLYQAWIEQIEPIYTDLEQKRSDTKFKKDLIRTIGFNDNEADRAIDYLIDERKQSLIEEVLGNLYSAHKGEVPYQLGYAHEFFSRSEADITDFFSRYLAFARSLEAAETHQVILCDPHSSWLERQRAALQIHKERQRAAHTEEARLEEIENELQTLLQDPDSLVGYIVAKNWNFITILDLRAKYQKQVDALSKNDKANPTKQLRLFERVTQSFRDREAEALAKINHTHSLKALRTINEDIYDLLLEVFDLDTTKRNRLLLDIQKHTRLTQERNLILLIQRNREQFLALHD